MFNKINVHYKSEGAFKLFVDYLTEDGETVNDYFFLDGGKETFGGLIVGYTEGKKASSLLGYKVKNLEQPDSVLPHVEITTELVEVLACDTYFIENERLKLGVRLIWGGGVNYILDKKCPVEGLTNLINQFDTGRLVQQSYYGCGKNEENDWGAFNGSEHWPYNPVQGGDKGNMHSRLIDVSAAEGRIYIKAQPRDWGKIGVFTPSYMENVYSIDGDMIRVDNKFTDYSGWKHPITTQELPAFYTVSYLDRYEFYDGHEPWQDKPLTIRDNLRFWGDPRFSGECSFPMLEDNTEIWSAWVSSKDDYGIGLYVPNTDYLYAGRNAYNGSKDPDNDGTNYIAPLCKIGIVSYRPIEYSYLMTVGSTDEIRSRFKANKDFAGNASLRINSESYRRHADSPEFNKYE